MENERIAGSHEVEGSNPSKSTNIPHRHNDMAA
jgi:hypothetical protein